MIRLQGVSKFFDSHQVLRDINLELHAGKVYGIVGQNGAGKTTLFRCVAGLESFHGAIHSELEPLKNHIGFLQTEPYFIDKLTGEEYIYLFCNARHLEIPDIKTQNIFDLPLTQYASTYSTGMKKKLALTAILLQKNNVFILDEPYNGVDIQSNILITEIILRLKAVGKTILISSHIFSSLNAICDEIFLLQSGAIEKRVLKDEFSTLEKEMQAFAIGDKLDNLKF